MLSWRGSAVAQPADFIYRNFVVEFGGFLDSDAESKLGKWARFTKGVSHALIANINTSSTTIRY